ncbi:MAG: gamma-glutamyl-gamma-aminobutyrate hydrolase family protein [Nitrospirae bacterium]|nr:gamma-glutamyl-gamma-aminobutyrate hydrolase family protein [Nitrospirota bacterium]
MRPIIGITPDFHSGNTKSFTSQGEPTYFLRARYVDAIKDLGGIPFILPIAEDPKLLAELLHRIDGLLITGSGPDLDPRLYGERPTARFKIMSRQRSAFELGLAKQALKLDRPVLGICGGLQLLNVAMDGSLIQDIATQMRGALVHQQETVATRVSHRVEITRGTRLHKILRTDLLKVNSSHHQAPKKIAPGWVVNAVATDGIIEGLESPRHRFAIGVQWHPEFLYQKDEASQRLFRAFLRIASLHGKAHTKELCR